jgi:KUP system potassium uptake protein
MNAPAPITPAEPAAPVPPPPVAVHAAHPKSSIAALTLGALGVVFGDIGTSPLYTLRQCLLESGGGKVVPADVMGLLSLIFWSLTMVVTVKYLLFIMRADNQGEGGIFALLALVPEPMRTKKGRVSAVAVVVVIGAALLYGDGAITPAISVLSAIEGLKELQPAWEPAIIPITCVILVGLFAMQSRGTGSVATFFGPVMVLWFVTISGLGIFHIAQRPEVLLALSPHHAVGYFFRHGMPGFLVLGSVVLAVTGGEALYADMGHFGLKPIRGAWLMIVFPALVLCYFGQGALVLSDAGAIDNPFFSMVPKGAATVALVVLSSAATVIASQALISGAFSLTRQAQQLGYFPRVTIRHTAAHTEGQIYIPEINWLIAGVCLLLVLGFQRSERLASAYGIAVTGTMILTSLVFFVVMRHAWKWSALVSGLVLVMFLSFDVPFFLANSAKILDGGWVPVLIGLGFITAMLIWSRGRSLVLEEYLRRYGSLEDALPRLEDKVKVRVPGTGAFMASSTQHVPPVMVHMVERMGALHERVVVITVLNEARPHVPEAERFELSTLRPTFWRLIIRYGFMEERDVPAVFAAAVAGLEPAIKLSEVTYFLGREAVLGHGTGAMGQVAESFFGYLQRNATAADAAFNIPPEQAVEVGIQLDL